ncbi:Bile acid:sodium symporter/arsenical resistance protein Acr3, partial [Dillenia turbinata]
KDFPISMGALVVGKTFNTEAAGWVSGSGQDSEGSVKMRCSSLSLCNKTGGVHVTPSRNPSSFHLTTPKLLYGCFNSSTSSWCSSYSHLRLRLVPGEHRKTPVNDPIGFRRLNSTNRLLLGPSLCGKSSNSLNTGESRSFRDWFEAVGEALSTAFPVWVALGPPEARFLQLGSAQMDHIAHYTCYAMTLTLDDLRGALAMLKEIIAGFVLQYSVMPLSRYFVSKLLNLPSYYAAGLILVGCCPGGTASNIATYTARGNVALSVLMTAASTITAVIMTPFLTAKLAGQFVAVDARGLLMSKLQVVLLPVLAGAFMNQYFQGLVKFVSPLMPPIAVGTVAVLCGNAIAHSSSAILMSGRQVVLAVCLLHAFGFFFGYLFARFLGIDVASSRTISIEVGKQNSLLGVVLATEHFGNPLTAVPCAVSSVCH